MSEDNRDVAISIKGVSKTFRLPHEKQTSLKGLFLNSFRAKRHELQKAVNDVSFEIKKGEFFGIVGRNGSGKSTLLKCIAGVYYPSEGKIEINGRLIPFIELGVGFNPELSGRDNVFLNGALLGFSRKQMEDMYDDIVEFAELERFMDQKLKNYSSGMQVRLAFSIAIRAEGDILLLDEVLAVGDAAFQAKCFDYFEILKNGGKTIIFISHDQSSLERFCDRGLLLNNGEIVDSGPIGKVLKSYSRIVLDEIEKSDMSEQDKVKKIKAIKTSHATIISTNTYFEGKPQKKFVPGETITVRFTVRVSEKLVNPVLGITVWAKNVSKPVFASNTTIDGAGQTGEYKPGSTITAELELPDSLNNGEYYVEPAIANESTTVFYDQRPKAATIYISGGRNPYSILSAKKHINLHTQKSIGEV